MKIAVLSDTHDHFDLIDQAINEVKKRDIKIGLHLGDFCMPYVMEMLGESGLDWHTVWGNNDGDRVHSLENGSRYPGLHICTDDICDIEIEGKKIAITHFPVLADLAAASGQYDVVFHGHTHQIRNEYKGNTLVANPGAVSGIRRATKPTFGMYDTESNTFETVDLI